MNRRFLLFVALFALAALGALRGPAGAQEPGSAAWETLRQHPSTWPAQLKLKADIKLTITDAAGRQVGALVAPADSMVQLLSVDATTLRVGVNAAQASIPPDQTDLAERLAAATPPPTTNTALATNTNVPPVTATNAAASSGPGAPTDAAPPPVASATEPAAPVLSAPPLEYDYDAAASPGYDRASFRFWSPPYTQPLRGLIVLTPGLDGDGRAWAHDPAWQALAQKYGLGLVASCLQGRSYQLPQAGTGEAFRSALRQFAQQASHPEIATLPLLLWGESAGGQWNYNYLLWRPEDVMAFVVNKGGYYSQAEADSRARAVPGLFILGQSDDAFRIAAITALWKAGRDAGALWALTPQPNSGHEFSKTGPLGRVFFEAVLKARLPDGNALGSDAADAPTLKPMQQTAGWLGNLTTHEIHDAAPGSEIDHSAAWLPDESTAQAWKVFVSGG
jgi:dienelactone hydrolase